MGLAARALEQEHNMNTRKAQNDWRRRRQSYATAKICADSVHKAGVAAEPDCCSLLSSKRVNGIGRVSLVRQQTAVVPSPRVRLGVRTICALVGVLLAWRGLDRTVGIGDAGFVCDDVTAMGAAPKIEGDRDGVDPQAPPQFGFIAVPVGFVMMQPAERDNVLIARLEGQTARLGEAQMVRIGGRAAADETGLAGDKPQMLGIAPSHRSWRRLCRRRQAAGPRTRGGCDWFLNVSSLRAVSPSTVGPRAGSSDCAPFGRAPDSTARDPGRSAAASEMDSEDDSAVSAGVSGCVSPGVPIGVAFPNSRRIAVLRILVGWRVRGLAFPDLLVAFGLPAAALACRQELVDDESSRNSRQNALRHAQRRPWAA